jgi:hypothetical protein
MISYGHLSDFFLIGFLKSVFATILVKLTIYQILWSRLHWGNVDDRNCNCGHPKMATSEKIQIDIKKTN